MAGLGKQRKLKSGEGGGGDGSSPRKPVWQRYRVELEFHKPLAAGLPKTPGEVKGMIESRMASEAAFGQMVNPVPVDDLVDQIAEEVGASEEEERGWATFKRDDQGIYFEARSVRSHLKDCGQQLALFLDIRGLKARIANRVYVEPEKLRLTRIGGAVVTDVDGTEARMIHVLTRQGPRSDRKKIDYVAPPCRMLFILKVLNDGLVDRALLETLFEYGATHGMGQERSQQWGQYSVVKLVEAEE